MGYWYGHKPNVKLIVVSQNDLICPLRIQFPGHAECLAGDRYLTWAWMRINFDLSCYGVNESINTKNIIADC